MKLCERHKRLLIRTLHILAGIPDLLDLEVAIAKAFETNFNHHCPACQEETKSENTN